MKLAAALITMLSLVAGAVAASTANAPRLSSIEPEKVTYTLKSPAGKLPDTEPGEAPVPIAKPGDKLTPELHAKLVEAGVKRVWVKEWKSISDWWELWIFALAVVGFIVATFFTRWVREAAEDAMEKPGEGVIPPYVSLQVLSDALDTLDHRIRAQETDDERFRTILTGIEEIQRTSLEDFVESRERLVPRLGLAGFARVMDRFAGAERMINRAWSSAADRVLEESLDCLVVARERLADTLEQARGPEADMDALMPPPLPPIQS